MYVGLKQQLTNYFTTFPERVYSSGQIIIYAGNKPTGVYFIKSGLVRQYFISKSGHEFSIMLYKPGTFFPISHIFTRSVSDTFFEAMNNKVVAHIAPMNKVYDYLYKNPSVALDFAKRLATELEGIKKFLEFEVLGDAYVKLAFSLFILVKQFGEKQSNGQIIIPLRLSQTELATFSGLTHETVNRKLMELKQNKIIDIQNTNLVITNFDQLEAILQVC